MAVWQFNVALLPLRWIEAGGAVGGLFGEEGFEPAVAWRGYEDVRLEESLDAVLPRAKSRHAELALWGSAEGDSIQLWRHRGRVESIQVHFDLRNPNMALFRQLTDFARAANLAIVVLATQAVLAADPHQLIRAAAESDAAHFVVDPASFLMNVSAVNAKAS